MMINYDLSQKVNIHYLLLKWEMMLVGLLLFKIIFKFIFSITLERVLIKSLQHFRCNLLASTASQFLNLYRFVQIQIDTN